MTIGHSTLPIESFLRALKENGCCLLGGCASLPRFTEIPSIRSEAAFCISRAADHTCRVARGTWRQACCRQEDHQHGLAELELSGVRGLYANTGFSDQIDWLMGQQELSSVVIMCAEALPWRCHRSLIGDAILARNGVVEDIFVLPDGRSSRKPHSMTPFARVEDGRLFYPPATIE